MRWITPLYQGTLMKKRMRPDKENVENINRYFLACEFKPHTANKELWSVLDPFAYDIMPAFIHGSLGILSYEPESYGIMEVNDKSPPLLGYLMTITHPATALILDKIKGFHGPESFNFNVKRLVHVYTDVSEVTNAWCYVVSDYVLQAYQQIEQIEFGLWDEDKDQLELLEKIEKIL